MPGVGDSNNTNANCILAEKKHLFHPVYVVLVSINEVGENAVHEPCIAPASGKQTEPSAIGWLFA